MRTKQQKLRKYSIICVQTEEKQEILCLKPVAGPSGRTAASSQ